MGAIENEALARLLGDYYDLVDAWVEPEPAGCGGNTTYALIREKGYPKTDHHGRRMSGLELYRMFETIGTYDERGEWRQDHRADTSLLERIAELASKSTAWAASADSQRCCWAQDGDGNWGTSCSEIFVLADGGPPSAHGMAFCCYCGLSLDEALHSEGCDCDEDSAGTAKAQP